MHRESPSYIIGIDLGTTNCTMAYTSTQPANSDNVAMDIVQYSIPQMMSQGVQGEHALLPSFIYFALQEELDAQHVSIAWDKERTHCVGAFARERGGQLPTRLIASAKSWLCHTGINRKEKLLPLGDTTPVTQKMSALEACVELLRHLREAWEVKMISAPFSEQQILITVPASFDPSARQLVQEAAEKAGYPNSIILLEEPQAAFYAWLHKHHAEWRQQLAVGDTILVVDIGGGTTDFSLISVDTDEGNLTLQRIAVGAHLLLGGDNFDLALACLARNKLEEQGHTIDEWQLQGLTHSCRHAKEQLLSDAPPSHIDITIHGRGSRLIGGTLTTQISQEEVQKLLINGFIPLLDPEERAVLEKKIGIQQIGLPYVQDPRISAQLAKFLSMTGAVSSNAMEHFVIPTAVLFNGGTLKAHALRHRLIEQLNLWAAKLGKPAVRVLPDPDYDFAVSRGAAYYGSARQGKQIRIRGGTSCSYYIGIEEARPAVPGIATPIQAVCIVPLGMEEGTEQLLESQEFALTLGELATFRFFSHSIPQLTNGITPTIGTVVRNWKQELIELPSIEALLDKGDTDSKTIRVKLCAKVTELGILELWCIAQDGRQWKLEFSVRS